MWIEVKDQIYNTDNWLSIYKNHTKYNTENGLHEEFVAGVRMRDGVDLDFKFADEKQRDSLIKSFHKTLGVDKRG